MGTSKLGKLLKAAKRAEGAHITEAHAGAKGPSAAKRPPSSKQGTSASGAHADTGDGRASKVARKGGVNVGGEGGRRYSMTDKNKKDAAASDLEVSIADMLGGGSAYEALMGAFANSSTALRRRRLEQEGAESESDEDELEEEEEEDEEDMIEEEDEKHDGGGDAQAKASQVIDSWSRAGIKAAKQHAAKKAEADLSEDEGAEDKSDEPDDGGDETLVDGGKQAKSKEAPKGKGQPKGASASAKAAAGRGAAAVEAGPDTWARHVDKELQPSDLVALNSASRKLADAPDHPHYRAVQGKGSVAAAAALGLGRVQLKWQLSGRSALPEAPPSLAAMGVKERLITRWHEVHEDEGRRVGLTDSSQQAGPSGRAADPKVPPGPGSDFASHTQRAFFAALNSYADVMVPCRPYPGGEAGDLGLPDEFMDAYLLHALNHVAKTADRIKKNNDRIEAAERAEKGSSAAEGLPRDQGFTRPKVLLLLPQRNLAFKLVRRLVSLAMKETRSDSVQGKEKFVEQFTNPEEVEEEEMEEKARARRAAKPAEWRSLFTGNNDDHFRLGIKITRGSIRLFADLFQSDIIVASPIAIATKLAEEAAATGGKGSPDADFLSSIEVLVVDRADMMTMQNWQHVEAVSEALNKVPKEQHGTDIMRVREWYLSGLASHFRQTVVLSSFLSADMNRLDGTVCRNHEGRLRLVAEQQGVLSAVVPQVQQLFERFKAASPGEVATARLEFFKRTVWPRIKEVGTEGMLIFIPSYFDFIRVRNFLNAQDADFASISEYTAAPDVTAARSRFFHGHRRILLYTERAHFYNRHRIRGIKDVLFYSAPEHAHYYAEILNLLEMDGLPAAAAAAKAASGSEDGSAVHATVTAMFCKYDIMQLERVVGSSRAKKMIAGDSNTFMFC